MFSKRSRQHNGEEKENEYFEVLHPVNERCKTALHYIIYELSHEPLNHIENVLYQNVQASCKFR